MTRTIRTPRLLFVACTALLIGIPHARGDRIVDFEDLTLGGPNRAISEPFASGGVRFEGREAFPGCCWQGYSYSNATVNQNLSVSPGPLFADPLFAIHTNAAYLPPDGAASQFAVLSLAESTALDVGRTEALGRIVLPPGERVVSVDVANTTYAAHNILVGDGFGGPFTATDRFTLSVVGWQGGAAIGEVEFPLAVGASVVDAWTTVDLGPLSGADTIGFCLLLVGHQPIRERPAVLQHADLRGARQPPPAVGPGAWCRPVGGAVRGDLGERLPLPPDTC